MSMAMICCSHSPLMLGFGPKPDADDEGDWNRSLDSLDHWVNEWDPELIALFYPDHFNGFFYRAMPSFCIGTQAESGIDWDLDPGLLEVPADIALRCVEAVREDGVDVALSHRMLVDHGVTIALLRFGGRIAARPTLPIMVNCNAPPLPSYRRVRLFGEAVGRFLAGLGRRVLVVGSGGLSHDPPNVPRDGNLVNLNERMIEGGELDKEDYDRRQSRIIEAAHGLKVGERPCLPPDPNWDRAFMQSMIRDDLEAYDDASDYELAPSGRQRRALGARLDSGSRRNAGRRCWANGDCLLPRGSRVVDGHGDYPDPSRS
jgi:2,3-dihydroxyphenylpropionate 1,2-dioxygenase